MGDEEIRGPDDQRLVSGLKVNAAISTEIFGEATYRYLGRDVAHFFGEAQRQSDDVHVRRRYARAAIVFLAFYLESIANLVFTRAQKSQSIGVEPPKDNQPRALRLLRYVLTQITEASIASEIDFQGLLDLFWIRNHLIAHPPGRADAGVRTDPRSGQRQEVYDPLKPRKGKQAAPLKAPGYRKFKGFPLQMSMLDVEHAGKFIFEVRGFLLKYRDSIQGQCTDTEVLGACLTEDLNALDCGDGA